MKFWKKLLIPLSLVMAVVILAVMIVDKGIARSDEELLDLLRKERGLPAESEFLVLGNVERLLCVEDLDNHVFYAIVRAPYWDGWKIERIYTNGNRPGGDGRYGGIQEKNGCYVFDWREGRVFIVDNPDVATVLLLTSSREEKRITVESYPSVFYVADFYDYREYFFLDKDGKDLVPYW